MGAHDYLPFGEEIPQSLWGRGSVPCYGQTDTAMKFTGQERDNETASGGSGQNGLDNYLARFMASGQGRFLSPDPDNAGADPTDPQSWNGYSYVVNNPLNSVDPTGLDTCYVDGSPIDCSAVQQLVNSGAAVQCPNNQCVGYSSTYGFLFYGAFGNTSGYTTLGGQGTGDQSFSEITSKLNGQVVSRTFSGTIAGLLGTSGTNFLQNATNAGLRDAINNLSKPDAQLGTGSTMDAIRYELQTGLQVQEGAMC